MTLYALQVPSGQAPMSTSLSSCGSELPIADTAEKRDLFYCIWPAIFPRKPKLGGLARPCVTNTLSWRFHC